MEPAQILLYALGALIIVIGVPVAFALLATVLLPLGVLCKRADDRRVINRRAHDFMIRRKGGRGAA